MTLCAAAVCENSMVVGISDRLITTGDIQFEPPRGKTFKFSKWIVGLIAGDTGLLDEVLQSASDKVVQLLEKSPEEDLRVSQVADICLDCYRAIRTRKAESAVLAPFGFTCETFTTKRNKLRPEVVSRLFTDFINFEPSPEGVEVLLGGLDDRGPHLYIVNSSGITCHDTMGFAAIGAGYWHAQSQFTIGRHTTANSITRTLLQIYSAKKRAEVAPGVGPFTDMVIVSPAAGARIASPDLIEHLDRLFQSVMEQGRKATTEAESRLQKYYDEVVEARRSAEQRKEKGQ